MSAKTTQGVEYYLGLRYPQRVVEIAEEDGGGFMATIPQLGSRTFVAVGETREEALEALDALRQHLIPMLLAEGAEFPEPEDARESLEDYSGNLMSRIPRGLHRRIVQEAKRNGTSVNKLVTQLLSDPTILRRDRS